MINYTVGDTRIEEVQGENHLFITAEYTNCQDCAYSEGWSCTAHGTCVEGQMTKDLGVINSPIPEE